MQPHFTPLDSHVFLHLERALAILAERLLPLEWIWHRVLSFLVSLKKKEKWQIICISTCNSIYERNHWGRGYWNRSLWRASGTRQWWEEPSPLSPDSKCWLVELSGVKCSAALQSAVSWDEHEVLNNHFASYNNYATLSSGKESGSGCLLWLFVWWSSRRLADNYISSNDLNQLL